MPENQIDTQIGKRLQVLRCVKGLSQEKVGTEIDVTFQQIQKYERGINGMKASKLYGLAQLFEVPIDYFFEEPENPGFDLSDLTKDRPDATKMLKHFARIRDPKLRSCLIELVNAAANERAFIDHPES